MFYFSPCEFSILYMRLDIAWILASLMFKYDTHFFLPFSPPLDLLFPTFCYFSVSNIPLLFV
jgi:hypothetical protein